MAYEYSYVFEEALDSGIFSLLFSGIPSTLLSITAYVLTALALYTVAQRRGLNRPWLAWIPVVNCWILGSLSDQYRYVVKGEIRSKRKVLLVLNVINSVLAATMSVIAIALVGSAISGALRGISEEAMLETILGPIMGIVGLCLPLAGVAIAFTIIRYIALYDVFKSMDPDNCVLFLVLSILIGITEPFFLFFSRNKDGGMPPRRQEPVVAPQPEYVQPEYVPVNDMSFYAPAEPEPWQQSAPQEPWEQEDKDYL